MVGDLKPDQPSRRYMQDGATNVLEESRLSAQNAVRRAGYGSQPKMKSKLCANLLFALGSRFKRSCEVAFASSIMRENEESSAARGATWTYQVGATRFSAAAMEILSSP